MGVGVNKEFGKISIFLGLFGYTTNGRELKFTWGKGKKWDWCVAEFESLVLRTSQVCACLLFSVLPACIHHELCFCSLLVSSSPRCARRVTQEP